MITTYCLRSTFVQFLLFDSDDDVFNQPHHTTKSGYNNFIIYRIDLLDTHVLSFYYYYFLMFVFSFHKEIDLVLLGTRDQTIRPKVTSGKLIDCYNNDNFHIIWKSLRWEVNANWWIGTRQLKIDFSVDAWCATK